MTDYNMLYEYVVLGAWGKQWRRTDPLALGDADTMGMVDNNLSGDAGRDVKVGLCAALRKVAHDQSGNDEMSESINALYERTWAAKKYDDICKVLDDAKVAFNEIGIVIV